jgi:hypothetical protein
MKTNFCLCLLSLVKLFFANDYNILLNNLKNPQLNLMINKKLNYFLLKTKYNILMPNT